MQPDHRAAPARPPPARTVGSPHPLFSAGGVFQGQFVLPRSAVSASSASSSSSSSIMPPSAKRSAGDILCFGDQGHRLVDLSVESLDAMAESVSGYIDGFDDEEFRRAVAHSIQPSTVLNGKGEVEEGRNVSSMYAKKGSRHNNNNLVGLAGDYTSDYAHHPRLKNPNPNERSGPAMLRAAVPAVAAPLVNPPPPPSTLTAEGRALRHKIILHFAQEFADPDCDALQPDPLVGGVAEGPLEHKLVLAINALAYVENVTILAAIAKLRKVKGP